MPPRLQIHSSNICCQSCNRLSKPRKRRRFVSTNANSPEIYDVVTVGGGPVGLALLAALKSSPVTSHLRTALIETQDLSKQRQWTLSADKYSNRASSLTPSSVSFLESSGAWSHVDQSRVRPYNGMQVWDASNDGSIQFDWKAEAQRYNAPARTVATMTENANLTKGLLERIHELKGESSLIDNTKVSSISSGEDDPEGLNLANWPVLSLASSDSTKASSSIATRLLIGADGFNSPVRSFAWIDSHGWDYNRHGVVATLKVEPTESFDDYYSDSANNATAYQRFLPQLGGPIAILPLPDNHASLVWSTTPSNAAYLKSLDEPSLVAIINAALRLSQTDIKYLFTLPTSSVESTSSSPPRTFSHEAELSWRLQHTPAPNLFPPPPRIVGVQENTIASFPLRFRHATKLTSLRVALVGDAAHTIHPLAGQGLNLGLADAASLADTIAYSVQHGMDIGDPMALERYSSNRYGKGLAMAGGVDLLGKMYEFGAGSDGVLGALAGWGRGLGMKVLNSRPAEEVGLKGWLMRRAEG